MKVVDMPEGKNDMIAALAMIKRNQSELIELVSIVAVLKFQAFSEYVKAGFTPEQAIELCKSSVTTL